MKRSPDLQLSSLLAVVLAAGKRVRIRLRVTGRFDIAVKRRPALIAFMRDDSYKLNSPPSLGFRECNF